MRAPIFDAIRDARGKGFTPEQVRSIDYLLDQLVVPRESDPLTARVLLEIMHHEAIVLEAYKDSVGVWTWSVGLADTGGHNARAYKDKPQSLEAALKAFVVAVRAKYGPEVEKAFAGVPLSEARYAAALLFHYNTGAIGSTGWVRLIREGKPIEARAFLETHYLNGGTLKSRRLAEAALFFDGKWQGDGTALVIPVSKPSYQPAFGRAKRVDARAAVAEAMA